LTVPLYLVCLCSSWISSPSKSNSWAHCQSIPYQYYPRVST